MQWKNKKINSKKKLTNKMIVKKIKKMITINKRTEVIDLLPSKYK
jgi:hypothetical protein